MPTPRWLPALQLLWKPCWAPRTWWNAKLPPGITAAPGRVAAVSLLLDVSAELAPSLTPFEAEEPYELLDRRTPELVPEPAADLGRRSKETTTKVASQSGRHGGLSATLWYYRCRARAEAQKAFRCRPSSLVLGWTPFSGVVPCLYSAVSLVS